MWEAASLAAAVPQLDPEDSTAIQAHLEQKVLHRLQCHLCIPMLYYYCCCCISTHATAAAPAALRQGMGHWGLLLNPACLVGTLKSCRPACAHPWVCCCACVVTAGDGNDRRSSARRGAPATTTAAGCGWCCRAAAAPRAIASGLRWIQHHQQPALWTKVCGQGTCCGAATAAAVIISCRVDVVMVVVTMDSSIHWLDFTSLCFLCPLSLCAKQRAA